MSSPIWLQFTRLDGDQLNFDNTKVLDALVDELPPVKVVRDDQEEGPRVGEEKDLKQGGGRICEWSAAKSIPHDVVITLPHTPHHTIPHNTMTWLLPAAGIWRTSQLAAIK